MIITNKNDIFQWNWLPKIIPIGTPMTDDNGKDIPSVPIAVPLCLESEISEIVEKTIGATIPPKAPIKSRVIKKNW